MILTIGGIYANIQIWIHSQSIKNDESAVCLYTKQKNAYKDNIIALLDMTYFGVNTLFDSPALKRRF